MSKKHFIELANILRDSRPTGDLVAHNPARTMWETMRDELADFCKAQNGAFNRQWWLDYINGNCGPSGGKVGK